MRCIAAGSGELDHTGSEAQFIIFRFAKITLTPMTRLVMLKGATAPTQLPGACRRAQCVAKYVGALGEMVACRQNVSSPMRPLDQPTMVWSE